MNLLFVIADLHLYFINKVAEIATAN